MHFLQVYTLATCKYARCAVSVEQLCNYLSRVLIMDERTSSKHVVKGSWSIGLPAALRNDYLRAYRTC